MVVQILRRFVPISVNNIYVYYGTNSSLPGYFDPVSYMNSIDAKRQEFVSDPVKKSFEPMLNLLKKYQELLPKQSSGVVVSTSSQTTTYPKAFNSVGVSGFGAMPITTTGVQTDKVTTSIDSQAAMEFSKFEGPIVPNVQKSFVSAVSTKVDGVDLVYGKLNDAQALGDAGGLSLGENRRKVLEGSVLNPDTSPKIFGAQNNPDALVARNAIDKSFDDSKSTMDNEVSGFVKVNTDNEKSPSLFSDDSLSDKKNNLDDQAIIDKNLSLNANRAKQIIKEIRKDLPVDSNKITDDLLQVSLRPLVAKNMSNIVRYDLWGRGASEFDAQKNRRFLDDQKQKFINFIDKDKEQERFDSLAQVDAEEFIGLLNKKLNYEDYKKYQDLGNAINVKLNDFKEQDIDFVDKFKRYNQALRRFFKTLDENRGNANIIYRNLSKDKSLKLNKLIDDAYKDSNAVLIDYNSKLISICDDFLKDGGVNQGIAETKKMINSVDQLEHNVKGQINKIWDHYNLKTDEILQKHNKAKQSIILNTVNPSLVSGLNSMRKFYKQYSNKVYPDLSKNETLDNDAMKKEGTFIPKPLILGAKHNESKVHKAFDINVNKKSVSYDAIPHVDSYSFSEDDAKNIKDKYSNLTHKSTNYYPHYRNEKKDKKVIAKIANINEFYDAAKTMTAVKEEPYHDGVKPTATPGVSWPSKGNARKL